MALFTYSRQWLGNGCMHLFTSAFLHVKQLLLLNTNLIKSPDFSNRIIYAIVTHFWK